MPGRDYTRAHELLRESVAGDLSYPSLTPARSSSASLVASANGSRTRLSKTQQARFRAHTWQQGPASVAPAVSRGRQRSRVSQVDPSFGLAEAFQPSDHSSSTRPSTPLDQRPSASPDSPLTPPSLQSAGDYKRAHALYERPSDHASFLTAHEYLGSSSSPGDSWWALQRLDSLGGRGSGNALNVEDGPQDGAERSKQMQDIPVGGNEVSPPASRPRPLAKKALAPAFEVSRNGSFRDRNSLTFLDDPRASEIQLQDAASPYSWFDADSPDEDTSAPKTPPSRGENKEADFVNMTPPKRLPSATKKPAVISAAIHTSPSLDRHVDHHLRHHKKNEHLRADSIASQSLESMLDLSPTAPERSEERSAELSAPHSPESAPVPSLVMQDPISSASGKQTKSASSETDLVDSRKPELPARDTRSNDQNNAQLFVESAAPVTGTEPTETIDALNLEIRSASLSALLAAQRVSPLSEISEQLLLRDAHAVRIASHNNHSLVLVQSGKSACPLSDALLGYTNGGPVHENTVDDHDKDDGLDAPVLLNAPGQIQEVFATNAPENLPMGPANREERATRPILHRDVTRHNSLMRRAVRTFSLKRSNTVGGRFSSARTTRYLLRDTSNHPFWQPREFWAHSDDEEDISESNADAGSNGGAEARPQLRASANAFARERDSSLRQVVLWGAPRRRPASYPARRRDAAEKSGSGYAGEDASPLAVTRIASLKRILKPIPASTTARSRSQRRRLTVGFKEKILEGTRKRLERQQQRQEMQSEGGPGSSSQEAGEHD